MAGPRHIENPKGHSRCSLARRAPDYSSNLCRLKYGLYDFFRGVLGLLPVLFLV